MRKTKAEFIHDILTNKRLDLPLKERLIELTSKELLNAENENRKRIEELERVIEKKEQIQPEHKKNNIFQKNEFKGKHKPKDVADFMKLFEDREGLKYLTHDFDESLNFNIQTFLEKSKVVFDNNSKKYSIPQSLWAIIEAFAFNKNPKWGYGGGSITQGWSSAKWINWSLENKKHLKRSEEFEKIITIFRDYTKIEAPKLKKIIAECVLEKFGSSYESLNIRIKDADKVTIYTHVDDFKLAFKLILDGIKKRIDLSNEITIDCLRKTEGEYYKREIRICHHNSYPAEPLDEFIQKISEGQKGELGDAIKKMRGYCNWSIESIWDNQPTIVNILQENSDLSIDFLKSSKIQVTGFTHILTFYHR